MIIAGTGHRPDKTGGYTDEAHMRLVNIILDHLDTLDEQPILISGMALGWDQALAAAAVIAKIKFKAYVPFRGQEAVWPVKSKKLYYQLIEQADSVSFISPGSYSIHKMQARNEAMVNDADSILAYWNGSKGGTANCITYAKHVKKPIVNLYQPLP